MEKQKFELESFFYSEVLTLYTTPYGNYNVILYKLLVAGTFKLIFKNIYPVLDHLTQHLPQSLNLLIIQW